MPNNLRKKILQCLFFVLLYSTKYILKTSLQGKTSPNQGSNWDLSLVFTVCFLNKLICNKFRMDFNHKIKSQVLGLYCSLAMFYLDLRFSEQQQFRLLVNMFDFKGLKGRLLFTIGQIFWFVLKALFSEISRLTETIICRNNCSFFEAHVVFRVI